MKFSTILMGSACAAAFSASALAQHVGSFPSDPPMNAQAGQCFERVRYDAEYNTVRENVIIADGYETYDVFINGQRVDGTRYENGQIFDPVLETNTRDYVSREAGMRYRVTEPVYQTVSERVQIQPGYSRYVVEPARLETVTERVMVREARLVWQRGYFENAHSMRHDPETGDIWCLVEQPAEYRTITRSVVVEPSRVRELPVEPEFAAITREVLVEPARVEEIPIPAEYASYEYRTLVHPAEVRARYIEERTDVLERYTLISGERYEWRSVDCNSMSFHQSGSSSGYHSDASQQMRMDPNAAQGADFDHSAYEGVPVASAAGNGRLHPGAPQLQGRANR